MKNKLFIIFISLLFSNVNIASEKNFTHNNKARIAVVDTGLDLNDPRFKSVLCKEGHKDFTGMGIEDYNSHGTHIAGIIKQYARNANYCLVIIKFYSDKLSNFDNSYNLFRSIRFIKNKNIKIVNISGGGPGFNYQEYKAIEENRKTKFFVAAGNENRNLDNPKTRYYPACYNLPNIFTVGNLDKNNYKAKSSNYGQIVKVWEIGEDVMSTLPGGKIGLMSGTSQATAVQTGKYIYENYR